MGKARKGFLCLRVTSAACIVGAVGLAALTAGAGTPISAMLLTAAMTQAGAYGINRLSSRADKREDQLEREAAEMERGLKNADVQRLMGRAVALALRSLAEEPATNDGIRGHVRTLADAVEAAWADFSESTLPEALRESNVSEFFNGPPQEIKAQPTLNADQWRDILEPLSPAVSGKLVDANWASIGAFLTGNYAKALYAVTKSAAMDDDAAWAGLLLRLLAEQREVLEHADQQATLALRQGEKNTERLNEIKDQIKDLSAAYAKLGDAALTRVTALLNAKDQRDDARYRSLFALMQRENQRVREGLSYLWTVAGRTETQVAALHTKFDAIKSDTADIKSDTADIKSDTAEIKAMLAQLLADRPQVAAAVAAQSAVKHIPIRTAKAITNIPAPEPHWIRRREITRGIRAMLRSEGGTASLTAAVATAAGGYGKTFAARIYAFEHACDYPGGRFELTMDKGNLQAQLASLLPLLSPGADLPPSQAAPAVKSTLEAAPASLLILDNIPNLAAWQEHVASGLVPGGHCHVLLTTREADVLPDRAVQVPRFTTEEAWTILARARPDALDEANVKWVGRVLRAADGLGVAIGAVAARMQSAPATSWRDYWTALVQGAPSLFADGALPPLLRTATDEPDDAQKGRWHALLDDCFNALPPALQRALEYTALMPPDLMPKVWLTTLMDGDESVVAPATGASVVGDLLSMRLLTPADAAGNLLTLHRLWHARVNERAEDQEHDRTPLLLALAACAAARRTTIIGTNPDGSGRGVSNPAALTDQSLRWELAPLASLCHGLWRQGQPGPAARVGVWLGNVLLLLGRFTEAAACLQLSHSTDAAVESAIGQKRLAAGYSNLAMIQQEQGDLSGARASIERAIELTSKHFAKDHPTFGISYSNLATIQQAQGDLPGARASVERAIEIDTKHFAKDHPTFATRYSNLAMIQQDQGDLPAARASIERAIEIAEQHLGAEHPNLASMRSNLAMIQQDQGDLPGARASMERAIEITSKHFAKDHPTFAISYNNLAAILKDLGQFAEALRYKHLSMEIERQHLGEDHPQRGASYSNLAIIQQDQGDLPAARASIEHAIAIDSKHFAKDHPTFATSYSNLAMIQQDQGDLPAARASIERAIEIDSKHFAKDHPTLATRYSNLAMIQKDQGDIPGARASMERAIAIDQKHFAPDHPAFAVRYNNLAHICYAEGDRAAACANFKKALGILRTHFPDSHPHIQRVLRSMRIAGCGE